MGSRMRLLQVRSCAVVDEQTLNNQLYWTGLLKKRKKARLDVAPAAPAKSETSPTAAADVVKEVLKNVVESSETPIATVVGDVAAASA